MRNIKLFLLGFIVVYILISLPVMLEIGYTIDWVPEATFLQKFKGSMIEGFTNNYLIKVMISIIVGAIFSLFYRKRNQCPRVH